MYGNLSGSQEKIEKLSLLYDRFRDEADVFLSGKGLFTTGYVWGFGNTDANVVLIGEAPGRDEVETGRPFAGKAGSILDGFLEGASVSRDDVFITNTIKYRLSRPRKGFGGDEPSNKDVANRPAKESELVFAADFIRTEIEILRPRIVVTLGNSPLKALYYSCFKGLKPPAVSECRGKPARIDDIGDVTLFPVFHPASLIYSPQNAPLYKEDLKNLSNYV